MLWEMETYRPQFLFAYLFLQPPVPLLPAIIHGIGDRTTQCLLPHVCRFVHTVQEKFHRFGLCPYMQICFVSFRYLGAASYELHYEWSRGRIHRRCTWKRGWFFHSFWSSDHLNGRQRHIRVLRLFSALNFTFFHVSCYKYSFSFLSTHFLEAMSHRSELHVHKLLLHIYSHIGLSCTSLWGLSKIRWYQNSGRHLDGHSILPTALISWECK